MKYLLNGIAVAAALAIAAPVWAQAPQGGAPMSPAAPAPSAAAPAAPAAQNAMPMASKKMHTRRMGRSAMRHGRGMRRGYAMHHRRGGRMMGSGDSMTEELNRQELARLQGGGAMGGPMGQPMMQGGAGQGGPRASGR